MRRSHRVRERVTIRDVARQAGVSPATVSNVLNGRSEAMAKDTLERVQAAIQSLSYRPNHFARGLVTRRTATIGLILSEIETPLFLQAVSFIEPIARRAGYNILVCNARTVEDERQVLGLLLEKQVDGMIFLSISEFRENEHLLAAQASGVPLVLINRSSPDPAFDQIKWDNTGGVVLAVDHLAQLGHRRIAHLRGPQNRRSSEERFRGYCLGLEQNHLEFREDYVRLGDYTASPDTWQQSAQELLNLSPMPTAIIASDDIVAAVILRTLQRAGLNVPRDVSVVGIDDQPFSTFLSPALTTVQCPVAEAGKQAIETLLQRIANPSLPTRNLLLPCPLILRESTGAPASRDARVALPSIPVSR